MADIVNLRPHHIGFLTRQIEGNLLIVESSRNPDKQELAAAANISLMWHNKYRKIYSDAMFDEVDRITVLVGENPAGFVRIVSGGDDICGKCPFAKSCLRGDYREVRDAYRKEGLELDKKETPVTKDEEVLKQHGLSYGDIRRVRELFKL